MSVRSFLGPEGDKTRHRNRVVQKLPMQAVPALELVPFCMASEPETQDDKAITAARAERHRRRMELFATLEKRIGIQKGLLLDTTKRAERLGIHRQAFGHLRSCIPRQE
jgi:hypothetical protein